MSDNVKLNNNEINEQKNTMLNEYKNLIALNEESRELLEEYAAPMASTILCSELVAYNQSMVITKWALIRLSDGEVLYISDRYRSRTTWKLNLNDLALVPGTTFKLKAVVTAAKDNISDVNLKYDPACNTTAFFEIKGMANVTSLYFIVAE